MELTREQTIEIAHNHLHKNEFDQASEICQKILQIDPQYSPAYYLLGLVQLRLNNFENARKYVAHSMSLDSSESVIHNTYGLILEKLGLLKSSALSYQWASLINPYDPIINYNLSNVLRSLNYQDEAEKKLRKAVKLDPNIANLESPVLHLNPTDISQVAFELYYQLVEVNYLVQSGYPQGGMKQYQSILGKKETVFFFCPDSGVTPHFSAQCIVARTIQSTGYQVIFLICPHLMYPFLCPDVSDLASWLEPEAVEKYQREYGN